MKIIKISVIIPVYNMEKYIINAIESVQKQTLKEIEIICIDDGSSDDSYAAIMHCVEKYQNVIALRQKNSGSGSARNTGIQKASGEFVCFLDADDFYASDDVLEYLYNLAKQKGASICGGSSCDYKNGIISTAGLRKERQFVKDGFISSEEYPGMTGYWAFIFKKELLIDNNIFFPTYLRGQDAPFFVKAIAYAKRVYCSSKLIYVYRKEHKSFVYSYEKALGIVSSLRDVFALSGQFEMKYIHRLVCEELKGEIGSLIYKYASEGDVQMNKLAKDFNRLLDVKLLEMSEYVDKKLLLEDDEIKEFVKENTKVKEELVSQWKNTGKVYIFGAGAVGKKVASFLKNEQVSIEAFIVSSLSNNELVVQGIPVKEVEQIIIEEKYIVIIATYWYSQKEIISMLRDKGINNIYTIDLRRFFLWQEMIEH